MTTENANPENTATQNHTQVNYKDMVAALAKPGEDILSALTPENCHSWHMATGIAGETSELLLCIKAVHLGAGKLDRKNAIEECGDLEFYIEGLATPLGIDIKGLSTPLTDGKLLDIATNISVHGGDVLDAVKREAIYNKELNRDALVGALIFLITSMNELYLALDFTREDAQEANKAKLLTGEKARYKLGKYSDAQANGRSDKEGEA